MLAASTASGARQHHCYMHHHCVVAYSLIDPLFLYQFSSPIASASCGGRLDR